MPPKTLKLLDDIRDAAAFIVRTARDRTLNDYSSDRLFRQAIERNFITIGEAMGRLARHDPATTARIIDHPRIIAFRNVLIHGYEVIDDTQVWTVIQQHLPDLLATVESLLKEYGEST